VTQYLLSNFGHVRLTGAVDADDTVLTVGAEDALKLPAPGVGEAFALTLWDGTLDPEIVYCTSNDLSGTLVVSRGEEGSTARAWLAGTEARNSITAATAGALLQAGFLSNNEASQAEAEAGVASDVLMTPRRATAHFDYRSTVFTREFLTAPDVYAARSKLGWESAIFSGTGLESIFNFEGTGWDNPYTKVYVDEVFVPATDYTITTGVNDYITFNVPPDAGVDNVVVIKGVNFAFAAAAPGDNTVGTSALVAQAVTEAKLAPSAVTSNIIAARAVTYAKIQNVSSTDKVLGRSTAGAGSVEEIPCTSFGRALLAAASVAAQQTILTSSGWPVPTGTLIFGLFAAAPAGYIDLNGGTIGSTASGASTRANADTINLYTEIWNNTAVADLPIYTSAGAVTAKGASAAADFAANKRLTIPDGRAAFFRGLDLGRGVDVGRALGSFQDEAFASHSHGISISNSGTHTHVVTASGNSRRGMNGGNKGTNWYGSSGDSADGGVGRVTSAADGDHTHPASIDNAGGSETRPRNLAFRVCIKL